MNYFRIENFYKRSVTAPNVVLDKIKYHISILNPIRELLGAPIIISKRSGYRPTEYEILKGRSGKSEHCYRGKGAVDLTCDPERIEDLLKLLLGSPYTRVTYYPENNFIHCDFKTTEKQSFVCHGGPWVREEYFSI